MNEIVQGIYRLKESTQASANPCANFENQIALYDSAFTSKQNVARVLGHEFSHILFRKLEKSEQIDFAKTAEWEGNAWNGPRDTDLTLNRTGLVEEDSQLSPEEDFANNIEYFLFDPKALWEKSPKVSDWISKKFDDKLRLRSVK